MQFFSLGLYLHKLCLYSNVCTHLNETIFGLYVSDIFPSKTCQSNVETGTVFDVCWKMDILQRVFEISASVGSDDKCFSAIENIRTSTSESDYVHLSQIRVNFEYKALCRVCNGIKKTRKVTSRMFDIEN